MEDSLLPRSLTALALIEENRQAGIVELKESSGLLFTIIKICQAITGRGGQAQQLDQDSLRNLQRCMSRACQTLENLKAQEANYFGIFKASIYLKDLNLLEGSMSNLLKRSNGPGSADMIWSDMDHLIENPSAKIFWSKHFGNEVEVSWSTFVASFELEYGHHPEEALERFKNAMVGAHHDNKQALIAAAAAGGGGMGMPPPPPAAAAAGGGRAEQGRARVCVDDYGRKTKIADGIYELFQHTSDPATMVYVMGTVEDDSRNNVVSYLPVVLDSFLGYSIEQVCCGGQHAAILTTSGHIYTWGRGGFGRLGHGDDVMCPTPRLVKDLAESVKCRQVACGFAYTAAVTTEGQVYTWGAGENGRLGLGDEQDKTSPKHVIELSRHRVKEIFAGSVHTCALLETGHVYSWGKSEYTGHGLQQDVWSPKLLDGFGGQPIVQISVGPGGYHTISLAASGEVYTWGHNRVGQLGYTNSEAVPRNHEGAFFLPTPRVVESLRELRVRRVIAGWGHSAVVCQNGNVYICGRNFQGQLGLGDPNAFERNERNHPYLANFSLLKGLQGQKVTQFACGGEHSAALLDSDDVYTFGSGVRGQLGHGEARNEHYPLLNQAMRGTRRRIKNIACGNCCTVLLTGQYRMPTLMEICIEKIVCNWEIYEHIDFSDLLPQELYNMLTRLRSNGTLGSHEHHHQQQTLAAAGAAAGGGGGAMQQQPPVVIVLDESQ